MQNPFFSFLQSTPLPAEKTLDNILTKTFGRRQEFWQYIAVDINLTEVDVPEWQKIAY